jgi:hypothetical protein
MVLKIKSDLNDQIGATSRAGILACDLGIYVRRSVAFENRKSSIWFKNIELVERAVGRAGISYLAGAAPDAWNN